ncbi:MAG: hypothetical protein ACKVT2_13125 [Saprospiraceae bacterium]
MKSARYPGVRPFETFQKDFFFGRDRDMADLFDLVMLQKMVVLFARSGYGKSSIINAGLVPKFQLEKIPPEERYTALTIRPGSFVEDDKFVTIDERLRHELLQKSPKITAPFLDNLVETKSLWYHFKQRQSPEKERYVLVFDQFEEFFTYPPEMQHRFNAELAELLYDQIPQSVRRTARAQKASEDQLEFLARPMDIKILFAIRSDRLALLDRMKADLPAIFDYRFELKALNKEQAKDAIVRPALLPKNFEIKGENIEFSSPTFEYNSVALEQILNSLAGGRSDLDARIEAFQLQIVCTWIEDEVRSERIADRDGNGLPDVMPEDLPDFANIFETYYKQQLDKLSPADREAARYVIEDSLLFVNSLTGEGRRLSVDKDVLLDKFQNNGLTDVLLRALEDSFLLRREANAMGGFSFEISHDALIEPIAKARKERLEEVERLRSLERAERERQEAEARAREAEEKARAEAERREEAERLQHEAEAQRHLAEKGRKRARQLTLVAVGLTAIASVTGFMALRSAKLAETRLSEIENANAKRDLMEFRQHVKNGDEMILGAYYNSATKYYHLADSLHQLHPNHEKFQQAAQGLSDKMERCKDALKGQ